MADALSRKVRVKPKRVRAMNMTLQSSIKDRILAAQREAVDESVGLQQGNVRGIRNPFRHEYDLPFSDRFHFRRHAYSVRPGLQRKLGCLSLVEFLYNNSYHSSVRCALFEVLYGRKCRSPIIYADKRRKRPEFSVGDYVLLKVSPCKGPVAYRLDFPEKLDGVHDTFYASNLKKCLADLTLQVPLDEIQVDAKLNRNPS
uniref:Reverse transcriptase domain-containing protein n=1 Tax=Tanacetum cinerariifolium TaxID=118510 RepID=A0A699H5H5_TANCI|nr:hypothetical protein [Tanacetum cinerariifolium]